MFLFPDPGAALGQVDKKKRKSGRKKLSSLFIFRSFKSLKPGKKFGIIIKLEKVCFRGWDYA